MDPRSSARRQFWSGVWTVAPICVGVAAFGLVFGAASANAGLSLAQTLAMSLFVFSGAAQITAVSMLEVGAAPLTILLTTVALGLRHILMGASLAPYLRDRRLAWRALLAFQMVDETFAVSIIRFRAGTGSQWFFLGANLSLYMVWAASSAAGALLGAVAPDPASLGLDLIFPLIFLGLLVPLLQNRIEIATALLAGAFALLGSQILPDRWYLISAALLASLCGGALESIKARRSKA